MYLDVHKMMYYTFVATQNSSLLFIEFTLCQDHDPTTAIRRNKLKYQTLLDTLEDVGWYVIVTIFTSGIRGGIHTNNITNLFGQWYILLMPIHATSPPNRHQIPHPTHTQQTYIRKPPRTDIRKLSKHQNHINTTKSQE